MPVLEDPRKTNIKGGESVWPFVDVFTDRRVNTYSLSTWLHAHLHSVRLREINCNVVVKRKLRMSVPFEKPDILLDLSVFRYSIHYIT